MLKKQDGFSLIGLIVGLVVLGILTTMAVPTFTAYMRHEQAKKIAGEVNMIRNAENTYLAKNNSFASLDQLATNGYISSNFLSSINESTTAYGSYYASTWTAEIGNQNITGCITDDPSSGQGCPNNPGVSNGYFLGLQSVPANFGTYFESEIPGSGIGSQGGGLEYVAYVVPVPSAPPVANSNTWHTITFYCVKQVQYLTVPSGTTYVNYTIAGAGGGGGSQCDWVPAAGGGGGSSAVEDLTTSNIFAVANGGAGSNSFAGQNGALYSGSADVDPGDIIVIWVGQGGDGSTANNEPNITWISIGGAGGWGYNDGGNAYEWQPGGGGLGWGNNYNGAAGGEYYNANNYGTCGSDGRGASGGAGSNGWVTISYMQN